MVYKFAFDIFFPHGKVFKGNRDGRSAVRHYLKERLVAKKLRIVRHENSRDFMGSTVCLRAEVYGCSFDTGEYVIAIFSFWLNAVMCLEQFQQEKATVNKKFKSDEMG